MNIAITIKSNTADFTPPGKRSAKSVQLRQGVFIRWYVSGRIYRTLSDTPENRALSREWVKAAGHQG